MEMSYLVIIGLLIIVIVILAILYRKEQKKKQKILTKVVYLERKKRSQSARYGYLFQNFVPLLKDFPYNKYNVRYIGDPIDAVAFELPKEVIFLEFKLNTANLTPKQRIIKKLIEEGKVKFVEINLTPEGKIVK